jgi:hypothetical protein
MHCGESGDAGRKSEKERQCLAVAHFADDGHVGCHSQEATHESAEVDPRTIGSCCPGLHARDVGQWGVDLEDLLRRDHPECGVEFTETARQQCGLSRSGSTREHHGSSTTNGCGEAARSAGGKGSPGHELVESGESHAGEATNIDHAVPTPSDVAMHDVEA